MTLQKSLVEVVDCETNEDIMPFKDRSKSYTHPRNYPPIHELRNFPLKPSLWVFVGYFAVFVWFIHSFTVVCVNQERGEERRNALFVAGASEPGR